MDFGTRRQRGVVKVDEIEFEKSKYPIKLEKATGTFMAMIHGKDFSGKNLDELKAKVLERLKEISKDREWEGVIGAEIRRYNFENDKYSFTFERHFRCKLPDGTYLFREFKGNDRSTDPEDLEEEIGDVSNRRRYNYPRKDTIYIPYSPEAWLGCKRIGELKEELNELLFKMFEKARTPKLGEKLAELTRAKVNLVVSKKKKVSRRKGK